MQPYIVKACHRNKYAVAGGDIPTGNGTWYEKYIKDLSQT